MAITNSDGSIILTTKVDESGLKSWFASVNSSTKTTTKNISSIGKSVTGLTGMFGKLGVAIAAAFSIQKIIQFSKESASLATQTEASIQRLVDIYGSASDSVGDFIDANARALGMSKSAAASYASVYGNLFSVWADQATNAELTNRYLNMTAVVASKTGRTVEDVQERIRSGLLGNTEAIEDLGVFVNVKTIEMTDAFQRMADGKSWEQLDAYTQQQIRSMAILEQATSKYGDEVANTSATVRNQFKAAYEDFQNSFGQLINVVLIPALKILTEIFTVATYALNALTGKSGAMLENANGIEQATSKISDNIEEQNKNQKSLNKEISKTIAGFDEINILSSGVSSNGVNSGGSPLELDAETNDLGIATTISSKLQEIMQIAAVSLLAIGLILLLFGNVPLGIGFIVAGAGAYGVSEVMGSGSPDEFLENCDVLIAFLAGLVSYLIAKKLLSNWSTFVKLWGDFRAFMQLVRSEGIGATIKGLFGDSLSSVQLWAIAIGVIVTGIAYLALNWDKLTPAQRTITILGSLAAAATTAAIAIALFHTSWSVGLAAAAIAGGIALLAGTYLFKSSNENISLSGGGSGDVPSDISQYESLAKGGTFSLPHLAQGAVIPPNREFLAVLGDQKQGVNIEAPLDTIVDAFRKVQDEQNFTIEATGSMAQLIKLLNLELKKENKRASVFGG